MVASILGRLAGKGVAKSFGQIKPPSRRRELPGLVDDTTSASPVKPPLQERGLPGLVDEMAPTSQVKLDSPEVLPLGKNIWIQKILILVKIHMKLWVGAKRKF